MSRRAREWNCVPSTGVFSARKFRNQRRHVNGKTFAEKEKCATIEIQKTIRVNAWRVNSRIKLPYRQSAYSRCVRLKSEAIRETRKFREFKRRACNAFGGDAIVARRIATARAKSRVESRGRQRLTIDNYENRPAWITSSSRGNTTQRSWEGGASSLLCGLYRQHWGCSGGYVRERQRITNIARASTWK